MGFAGTATATRSSRGAARRARNGAAASLREPEASSFLVRFWITASCAAPFPCETPGRCTGGSGFATVAFARGKTAQFGAGPF
jgi:hypothetical protein